MKRKMLLVLLNVTMVASFVALPPPTEPPPAPLGIHAVSNSNAPHDSITAPLIIPGQVVKNLNRLKDNVILGTGTNVTLTSHRDILTIAACSPSQLPDPDTLRTNTALCQRTMEAPNWAVAFGNEFWRKSAPHVEARVSGDASNAASVNIGNVIERVSHAIQQNGTAFRASAGTYSASFDEQGLRFSPHRPHKAEQPSGIVSDPSQSDRTETADRRETRRGRKQFGVRPDPQTEAAFRTVAIRSGEETLYEAAGSRPTWAVVGNTAQSLLNAEAGLVEHYETRAEGVEVTWVLPKAPAGTAALEIEAEVEGLTFAARTETGLHFANASGEARMQIANVTVVDSVGQRWPVNSEWNDNRLRVTVPAEILARATYPLAVDPLISSEFNIGTPIRPSERLDHSPAVAAGINNDYWIVWQSDNIGGGGVGMDAIVAANVSGTGQLLTPNGLLIARGHVAAPDIASGLFQLLIVWQVETGDDVSRHNDIYGARLTWDGNLLPAFPIATGLISQEAPAVTMRRGDESSAFRSDNWFVIWKHGDGNSARAIYGARVNSASVDDPAGILIHRHIDWYPHGKKIAAVACGRDSFLVAYERYIGFIDGWEIYGAWIGFDGTVRSRKAIGTGRGARRSPAIATDETGSGYLVAWQSEVDQNSDIVGTIVTTDGNVLNPRGIPISSGPYRELSPTISFLNGEYMVVWQQAEVVSLAVPPINLLCCARVTMLGVVRDPLGIRVGGEADQFAPDIASNGDAHLVVWEQMPLWSSAASDVYGAILSADGVSTPAQRRLYSSHAFHQSEPAVAFNGTDFLVAWTQYGEVNFTDYLMTVHAARVSQCGRILDPAGFSISEGTSPKVASIAGNYLVVFEKDRDWTSSGYDVYGQMVSGTGALGAFIEICTQGDYQGMCDVAANGNNYLVVWTDHRNWASTGADVYAARISPTGFLFDLDGFPVCRARSHQGWSRVASSGSDYMVVWADERDWATSRSDIYGTVLTGDGVVRSPNGISISDVGKDQSICDIAASADGYLVVWSDWRNEATTALDIYGARIARSGELLDRDGIRISTMPGNQQIPAVASDGVNYLVVWDDGRHSFTARGSDIYGARVSNNTGTVLELSGIEMNANPRNQSWPALAQAGVGRFLIVCQSFRDSIQTIAGTLLDLNANSQTDRDRDGIPDVWEWNYGLDACNGNDTSADTDGDGRTNLEEYIADTNPLDPQSNLIMSTGVGNPGQWPPTMVVSWISSPKRLYRIWMRDSLNPSSPWVDSGFGIIQPVSGVGPSPMRAEFGVGPSPKYRLFGVGPSPLREVSGVGPSPMRIFRIEVMLPPAGR